MSTHLRRVLAEFLLLVPSEKLSPVANGGPEDAELGEALKLILDGRTAEFVAQCSALTSPQALQQLARYPAVPLRTVLGEFVAELVQQMPEISAQIVGVALLQLYIQANFTGPQCGVLARQMWFPHADAAALQADAVKLLNIEGKTAYDLMNEPLFLVVALLVFEQLHGATCSLVPWDNTAPIEEVTAATEQCVEKLGDGPVAASLAWWRTRALQVHLAVVSEPSDILASVSAVLLGQRVVNALVPAGETDVQLQKHLQLLFLLESARNGLHAQTEHLSEPFLRRAREVSQLELVLSGARAKRTKFQTFHATSLILLARSADSALYTAEESQPESLQLDSDLLLEKPEYEALDAIPDDHPKKIKLDDLSHLVDPAEKRLLPIAMHQQDIPAALRGLDPNSQPTLSDLDNVQLLLVLATLRQTSPAGNAMVDEELSAVVNRIVYATTRPVNWSVFARALWERSVLETGKARTVERGILQMTSLVEEVGINITSTVMPKAAELAVSAAAARLRFVHQLPLMAQWSMDAKLAEKYMSLGVIKSALEIYERLQLATEAALCYAATDDEAQAVAILQARIRSHPEDARAISILGDIQQDPQLWEKAWQVGRYAKAKASLAKYHYRPPPHLGQAKNLAVSLEHMHDCLRASPLSYENWFFYGCCGLESEQWELAAEAFTRCVSLDDTNSHAWSNLASALLKLGKDRQAFTALKRALQQGEGALRSWRIYENYLLVAAKLGEWNDVLHATRELVAIRKEGGSDGQIDIPVVEKLVQILVEEPYSEEKRMTHFQQLCVDLVCNVLPSVVSSSARAWRVVSRVELWRGKPWLALECHEKAYRATSQRPDLDTSEEAWSDAVEACLELVSAYESLGDLPGKHGAGDVVCSNWKYKARTSVRSLMSKGKAMWEGSEGWEALEKAKAELSS